NTVQPNWRFAIITMQTMPRPTWTQRLAEAPSGAAPFSIMLPPSGGTNVVGCEDQLERHAIGAVDEDLMVFGKRHIGFVKGQGQAAQALDRLRVASTAEGDVIDARVTPAGLDPANIHHMRLLVIAGVADVNDRLVAQVQPVPPGTERRTVARS